MAKHTPGPWTAVNETLVRGTHGEAVAATKWTGQYPVCLEHNANARLIAAAPDALAACKMALAYLNYAGTENFERGGDRHVREVLESAIRKATEE